MSCTEGNIPNEVFCVITFLFIKKFQYNQQITELAKILRESTEYQTYNKTKICYYLDYDHK